MDNKKFMAEYQKQTDKPLYPNLLWSRPETSHGAGKLLIIGGQAQEFSTVAAAYTRASKAGAGTIRVFMPESTRKHTKMLPNIEYAAANPSGSFARSALAELLEATDWADAVLLAGDLGKNSETSLLLEDLILKYDRLLALADTAIPSLSTSGLELLTLRENSIIGLSFNDAQKLGIAVRIEHAFVSSTGEQGLATSLHELSQGTQASYIMCEQQGIWTAAGPMITKTKDQSACNPVESIAAAVVWTMQNPSKINQSLVSAAYTVVHGN